MIALVGGRGVIGRAAVDLLRSQGRKVTVVTHDREAARRPGFRYGDLLRPDTLATAVAGAEVVIQSATFPTFPIEKPQRRHTFVDFDGRGTECLVAAARRAGARRFIYVSGCGTRGDSRRPYFRAHWQGEQAVWDADLEGVVVRPAFVYGPRDRGLNRLLRLARRSPVVPVLGDGSQLHQPVHVEDVARAIVRTAEVGAPEGLFEVGGPERMTLDGMLETVFATVGLRRRLVHLPYRPMRLLGRVMEHLPGPLLTAAAVDFVCEDFLADLSTLEPLRLEPKSFCDGLRTYLAPPTANNDPPGG